LIITESRIFKSMDFSVSLFICELCFSVGQATSEVARRRSYHVVFVPLLSLFRMAQSNSFY